MLALIVLGRYGRYHVLIVWLQDLKYAQVTKAVAQRNQRGRMHTPAPRAPVLRVSQVTYPGASKCISAVRAHLRQLLGGCPIADDVILCASELAANATVHSRSSLPGGTFTVLVKISPSRYTWIAVEDSGGPWNPAASDPARPHGLEIVRALASEWGIDGDHNTRTIWAKFIWPDDS